VLVKPYAERLLAGICRPWDLKMPLVVIANRRALYIPYNVGRLGRSRILTKAI